MARFIGRPSHSIERLLTQCDHEGSGRPDDFLPQGRVAMASPWLPLPCLTKYQGRAPVNATVEGSNPSGSRVSSTRPSPVGPLLPTAKRPCCASSKPISAFQRSSSAAGEGVEPSQKTTGSTSTARDPIRGSPRCSGLSRVQGSRGPPGDVERRRVRPDDQSRCTASQGHPPLVDT